MDLHECSTQSGGLVAQQVSERVMAFHPIVGKDEHGLTTLSSYLSFDQGEMRAMLAWIIMRGWAG